jgi:hypothetical protein
MTVADPRASIDIEALDTDKRVDPNINQKSRLDTGLGGRRIVSS